MLETDKPRERFASIGCYLSLPSISDLFSSFPPELLVKTVAFNFSIFNFSSFGNLQYFTTVLAESRARDRCYERLKKKSRDANVKLISGNVRKAEHSIAHIKRIYLVNARRPSNSDRNPLAGNDFGETFQKVVKLASHGEPLTWHPSRQHCENHISPLAANAH